MANEYSSEFECADCLRTFEAEERQGVAWPSCPHCHSHGNHYSFFSCGRENGEPYEDLEDASDVGLPNENEESSQEEENPICESQNDDPN